MSHYERGLLHLELGHHQLLVLQPHFPTFDSSSYQKIRHCFDAEQGLQQRPHK
jgi:hypothetical protein